MYLLVLDASNRGFDPPRVPLNPTPPQIPKPPSLPAFPVDTHIHRLAQRWGLTTGNGAGTATVEATERDLKALFPEDSWSVCRVFILVAGGEVCCNSHHLSRNVTATVIHPRCQPTPQARPPFTDHLFRPRALPGPATRPSGLPHLQLGGRAPL